MKKRLRMDLKIVQKLIQMMERGGVHELELVDPKEGIELRLKRGAEPAPAPPMSYVPWMHAGPPAAMPMAGHGRGLAAALCWGRMTARRARTSSACGPPKAR